MVGRNIAPYRIGGTPGGKARPDDNQLLLPRGVMMLRRLLVPLVIAWLPVSAAAQVVRGTITERASGALIPGALVTLEPASGNAALAVSVLSNMQGEYAVRATAAGTYRLSAKRIGAQRFLSEAFALGASETRRLDIVLEALVYRLPEVRVMDVDVCVKNEADRLRVSGLWDEARTVLTAAQISLRDRLFEGHLSRYLRGLHPRSLRVLEESWGERKGVMDRPFVSVSGDSLSLIGYRRTIGEYEYYYAPDAEVLLSKAFQRDHCFSVVEANRDRRGMIGLGFEPRPNRRQPDVRGTLWLDARTFELQLVEFKWTQLSEFEGSDRVGGEVHFGKLANGAWVTSRWFMRFPQFVKAISPVDAYTRVPSVQIRPAMHRLVEEGGMVFTTGLKLYQRPSSIAGTVLDSAGRPFPGTSVRLGGTPFTTESGPNGAFRLDSLPAGRFQVIVEHPGYTQAGSFVASETLDLTEGGTSNLTMRAARTSDLISRMCDGKLPKRDNGVLRVIVVDSITSRPLPSLRVWLRWTGRYVGSMERVSSLTPSEVGGLESTTNAEGVVTFCDLPADMHLVLSAVKPDGKPASDSTFLRAHRNELRVSTVVTRRPQ
jgi:hypothetical protein